MKKTLHLFIAFMCLLTTNQAMEPWHNPTTFKSKLCTSQIDFNAIINPEEKERIEIHFFWTTGRPYDLLNDEYGADRHVDIGGAKWGGKFKSTIFEFLNFVPKNVNVVFVCDRLTHESNEGLLYSLRTEFGERFKPLLWENLTTEIYAKLPPHDLNLNQFYHNDPAETLEDFDKRIRSKLPECESYLKLFFDQGFCGNPAIASDVYRLVGMPISCSENGVSFEKTMWTYTDVDTFCYALENDRVDDYLRAIMGTSRGTFSHRPHNNNDVIKLGFSSVETYDKYENSVINNLIHSYYSKCCFNDIHVMNYLETLFTFLQNNDFKGYMEKYAQEIDKGVEWCVMGLTGPVFVDTLNVYKHLNFPSTCTLEWNPSGNINNGGTPNYHIDCCGYGMYDLMDTYMPHLRRAIALKRFGGQHPFNVELLRYLKNNNPYESKEYRVGIEEYKKENSINNVILKKILLEKEMQYSMNLSSANTIFFRFRAALRTLGIEFPIIPEGDKINS